MNHPMFYTWLSRSPNLMQFDYVFLEYFKDIVEVHVHTNIINYHQSKKS